MASPLFERFTIKLAINAFFENAPFSNGTTTFDDGTAFTYICIRVVLRLVKVASSFKKLSRAVNYKYIHKY